MSITFHADKAKLLADELAKNVMDNGFNAMSKNDFYDFVLHLLSKHSNEKFLHAKSNHDNAYLLKVKPEKIKSSKLSIFLKYADPEEQKQHLSRLIPQITDGTIQMVDDGENTGRLRLTIEDPAMRFSLDGKMKSALGVSPDTSFNSEILVVRKEIFFKLLRLILQEDEPSAEARSAIMRELQSGALAEDAKSVCRYLLDGVLEVAGKTAWFLPVDTIKEVLNAGFQRWSIAPTLKAKTAR